MKAAAKRVAVLGFGELAVHVCEVVVAQAGWELVAVVPVAPEPEWAVSLSGHVVDRWPRVQLVSCGDWRELVGLHCDLVVSAQYTQLIGAELIDDCGRIVNIHPGRLPEYRGMRPVHWALRNAEPFHGVTMHEIDSGIDTGPVVGQVVFPIWPDIDEVRDVWDRSMAYGKLLIDQVLPRIDLLKAIPQDPGRACTYYRRDIRRLGDRAEWSRQA